MSSSSDSGPLEPVGEGAPPQKRHKRGRKAAGSSSPKKQQKVSNKLLYKRISGFPSGTFEAREGQMWCRYCDMPIRYDHPNFAKYHVEHLADHKLNVERQLTKRSPGASSSLQGSPANRKHRSPSKSLSCDRFH